MSLLTRKPTFCICENKGSDQLHSNCEADHHLCFRYTDMSLCMRKPTICICENKGTEQLRGNREADQHLCFRYTDSTIPLLSKSKISSLYPSSVLVQLSLCRTGLEPKLLVYSHTGSNRIPLLSKANISSL